MLFIYVLALPDRDYQGQSKYVRKTPNEVENKTDR